MCDFRPAPYPLIKPHDNRSNHPLYFFCTIFSVFLRAAFAKIL